MLCVCSVCRSGYVCYTYVMWECVDVVDWGLICACVVHVCVPVWCVYILCVGVCSIDIYA